MKNIASISMVCFIMFSSLLSAKNNNPENSLINDSSSKTLSDSLITKKENINKPSLFINKAKIYVTAGAFIYDSLKLSNVVIHEITNPEKEKRIVKKENPIKKQERKKGIKTSTNLIYYNSLNDEHNFQLLKSTKMTLFFQSQTPQYSKNTNDDFFSWAKYVCITQGNEIYYTPPHISNLHFMGRLSVRPPTSFL